MSEPQPRVWIRRTGRWRRWTVYVDQPVRLPGPLGGFEERGTITITRCHTLTGAHRWARRAIRELGETGVPWTIVADIGDGR